MRVGNERVREVRVSNERVRAYLQAVVLCGDDEGLQTQGGLLQLLPQS